MRQRINYKGFGGFGVLLNIRAIHKTIAAEALFLLGGGLGSKSQTTKKKKHVRKTSLKRSCSFCGR